MVLQPSVRIRLMLATLAPCQTGFLVPDCRAIATSGDLLTPYSVYLVADVPGSPFPCPREATHA